MLEIRCSLARGAFALDVDLALPSSGVNTLFGASGAGKSTLIEVLAGLLPAQGRIALDGEVLLDTHGGIDVPAARRAIGYVFQDGRLFPHYDVEGNLRYGERRARGRAARVRFEQVLELLGIGALLQRRPAQLSGGEKQRVALGRALLSQPRLLLLDEPLAALDVARKQELLPYFERLRDEFSIPIVYVSHAFDEVIRIAQHVVLLDRGRVTLAAPLAEACLSPLVHAITGAGVVGAVLEGVVISDAGSEGGSAATLVRCGELRVRMAQTTLAPGAHVRLHLAADDVAVAREPPRAISIRNVIAARIQRLEPGEASVLVHLLAQGERLLARVTHGAARELNLESGGECYALFKAVATHGRRFERAGLRP
ncbi:MAG TPA: molybdenum ABC transporter ATP-binding protein [Steroidobacteraceae bacterium]|nr:molybdenum ABC transporter ATP-binding protein [Steroidobacteraceae bacterium]